MYDEEETKEADFDGSIMDDSDDIFSDGDSMEPLAGVEELDEDPEDNFH